MTNYIFTQVDGNAAWAAMRELNGVSIDGGKSIKVCVYEHSFPIDKFPNPRGFTVTTDFLSYSYFSHR